MRKQLLLIALVTISCINAHSQIIFENGYFIIESNKRIECLIKNVEWKNNPTEFEYKLSQNDSVQKVTIQTVKEFGINNGFKYIRAKTNIDRSSNVIDNITSEKNPIFQEELLFLKVLIEGNASLFLYIDDNLTRLFYKLNDSEINQLVYKRYIANDKIFENNYYKQQLFLQLKCEKIGKNDFEHLRYSKRDFKKIIIKYNECTSSNYIIFEPKQNNDFNLTIRPGFNYSSLEIQNSMIGSKRDFGSNSGVRFGVEAEFTLPFNKNKWGIIVEPTYQYFKKEQSEVNAYSETIVTKADYKSIELPVGVRYNIYLNHKSKLFTNISCVFDFPINSSIKTIRKNDGKKLSELDIKSRKNLAFGIGYRYNNRYSLEIRYSANREILSDYLSWSSKYSSLNIILGVSIF